MAVCKYSSLGTSQVGIKAHGQRDLLCLQEVTEDKVDPGLGSSSHVYDKHFLKAVQKSAQVKRLSELVPGREKEPGSHVQQKGITYVWHKVGH